MVVQTWGCVVYCDVIMSLCSRVCIVHVRDVETHVTVRISAMQGGEELRESVVFFFS